MNILEIDFLPELQFQASRSSGAGGQNVNKVSSKVELRFNVVNSQLLDESQKALILQKLKNQINSEVSSLWYLRKIGVNLRTEHLSSRNSKHYW
jgi:protein subunit release factor B